MVGASEAEFMPFPRRLFTALKNLQTRIARVGGFA